MQFKNPVVELTYNILIASIALLTMGLVLLDALHIIYLYSGWLNDIFWLITIIYGVNYLLGFFFAPDKRRYALNSVMDLISLVPTHPFFVFFRLMRVVQIIRYYHIFWRFGWDGKFTKKVHQFVYDTGFIYLFSISILILITAALLFGHFEHHSLKVSLWWAITTATTVGYGDFAPQTTGGRLDAAVLMVGGIGFIGLLTSTITDFFTKNNESESQQSDKIDQLTHDVETLTKEVRALRKSVNGPKKRPTKKKQPPKQN